MKQLDSSKAEEFEAQETDASAASSNSSQSPFAVVFPLNTIKKIVSLDPDAGKMQKDATILLNKATVSNDKQRQYEFVSIM